MANAWISIRVVRCWARLSDFDGGLMAPFLALPDPPLYSLLAAFIKEECI